MLSTRPLLICTRTRHAIGASLYAYLAHGVFSERGAVWGVSTDPFSPLAACSDADPTRYPVARLTEETLPKLWTLFRGDHHPIVIDASAPLGRADDTGAIEDSLAIASAFSGLTTPTTALFAGSSIVAQRQAESLHQRLTGNLVLMHLPFIGRPQNLVAKTTLLEVPELPSEAIERIYRVRKPLRELLADTRVSGAVRTAILAAADLVRAHLTALFPAAIAALETP